MAAQEKFLIPADELSLSDKKAFRAGAIAAGKLLAVETKAVRSMDACVVRHADPLTDFGMVAGGWVSAALAVVGNQYSVFNALTPQLANNRVAVFYAVAVEAIPFPVSLLSFREGVVATTTYAVFDLEQLVTMQQQLGYFSTPIPYEPQKVLNVSVTARIVAGVSRIWLGCYIIEPGGSVVSG